MKKLNLNAENVRALNYKEMLVVSGGSDVMLSADDASLLEMDPANWSCFGKNTIGTKGWYTINLLWIPIGVGKEF